MSTRNLDALFAPKTIALIGASNESGSVGAVLASNLLGAGFPGAIFPVNPHEDLIGSARCYRSIEELPERPDLAVIATPPRTVAGLVSKLGMAGCRAAVIITAGFDRSQRQALLAASQPHLLRIAGPNCLGFLSPQRGINASFAHKSPLKGHLALVTQSGAIATSIIDWSIGREVGFSHILSLGDMADVDFGDLLDYLALDADTHAILLYAESIAHARKFMSAGRIAARAKPVIIVKAGRSRAGAAAAASHTGALAGADDVYDAAIRRAGMLRVATLRELFDAAETLASGLMVGGSRLTVLTNGGGLGVLAADALEQRGGELAALEADKVARLDQVLPASWSHANPVDILGDAGPDRYEAALDVLADHAGGDALLVLNCPTGVADSALAAQATAAAKRRHAALPMITCWMGSASTAAPRRILSKAGLPTYETPDEAVAAFLHLAEFTRNQQALFETPSLAVDRPEARRPEVQDIVRQVIAEGRSLLTEPEAKSVLAAYGVPVVATRIATSPEEVERAATAIGRPVAVKILSRDITHKTDVGGVRLDLGSPQAARRAAEDMLVRVRSLRPDASIEGFTVQEMIKRPNGRELILGAMTDPTFGPCLLFGHGGVATEVVADRCLGLPPLNLNLARDMIGRTRIARLLSGYRDRPPARLDAIAEALVALSDVVAETPEISELDINPLLADENGVIALDARIVVKPASNRAALAIRPYPRDLVKSCSTDRLGFLMRPIRPDDGARLVEMAQRTDVQDLRMRFHGAVGTLSPQRAARLSQIDYDREMVFVAEMTGGDVGGVVRLIFDPNFETAECAILVRTDVQRHGIGRALLAEALSYVRQRGARKVWGDVLTGNRPVIDLAHSLGAHSRMSPQDGRLTRIELEAAPVRLA